MTHFAVIVLPDKVFLKEGKTTYGYINLQEMFLFDDQVAKPTHKPGWYELQQMPRNVQKKVASTCTIDHYKLKDGFIPSAAMPATMPSNSFWYDDDLQEYENADIKGCYEMVKKELPASWTPEEFTITTVATKDTNWVPIAAPANVQHLTIDEILNHSDLLQDTYCFLSPEESYKRIRSFISANINPQYAVISSDYDFKFAIEKKLKLAEPEPYERCVNIFAKKPKYVKDLRRNRCVSFFNMKPKPETSYKDTPVAPKFEGSNYAELESNITAYLQELITKINAPLKDCECCKGTGVSHA